MSAELRARLDSLLAQAVPSPFDIQRSSTAGALLSLLAKSDTYQGADEAFRRLDSQLKAADVSAPVLAVSMRETARHLRLLARHAPAADSFQLIGLDRHGYATVARDVATQPFRQALVLTAAGLEAAAGPAPAPVRAFGHRFP